MNDNQELDTLLNIFPPLKECSFEELNELFSPNEIGLTPIKILDFIEKNFDKENKQHRIFAQGIRENLADEFLKYLHFCQVHPLEAIKTADSIFIRIPPTRMIPPPWVERFRIKKIRKEWVGQIKVENIEIICELDIEEMMKALIESIDDYENWEKDTKKFYNHFVKDMCGFVMG